VHFPQPFKHKIDHFSGYRNHTITDTVTELPIHEKTLPADKDKQKIAVPLLKELTSYFDLPVECVIGDANYDTEEILSHVYHEMKALPIIPRNPRRTQNEEFKVKKDGVLCPANLEMNRKGKMKSRSIAYLQYNCPLQWGKKYLISDNHTTRTTTNRIPVFFRGLVDYPGQGGLDGNGSTSEEINGISEERKN